MTIKKETFLRMCNSGGKQMTQRENEKNGASSILFYKLSFVFCCLFVWNNCTNKYQYIVNKKHTHTYVLNLAATKLNISKSMVLISRGLAAQYFQEVLWTKGDSHYTKKIKKKIQTHTHTQREKKVHTKCTHIEITAKKLLSLVQNDNWT